MVDSVRNVPFTGWKPSQVVAATLTASAVVLAFWLARVLYRVLFLAFVAIVLATALRPAIEWIQKRVTSRTTSTLFVYLSVLALVLAALVTVVPMIVDETMTILQDLPKHYAEVRQAWLDSPSPAWRTIGKILPPRLEEPPLPTNRTGDVVDVFNQAFGYLATVIWIFLATTLTLLLAFYWSLEGERTLRSLLLWAPPERRDGVRDLVSAMEMKVGAYVRGQSLLCLIVGSMALVSYVLIGLPQALALGCMVGILEAVPVFGPIIGAIPPLLTALSRDPTSAIWVIVANTSIQQVENYLLVPRIMGRSVGINPIVTLLAIVAFGGLIGPLGAVMAIPMAAVLQTIFDRYLLEMDAVDLAADTGRGRLSRLRYETQQLLVDLRKQLRSKADEAHDPDDELEDRMEAIALELDQTLVAAGGSSRFRARIAQLAKGASS